MEEELVGVANYKIEMDGSNLPDDVAAIIESVTVEEEINLPSMFTFKFGCMDFEKGEWKGIDLGIFTLGKEIKIALGFDQTEELITGEITGLEPTFAEKSTLLVRGYDRLHRLRFGAKRRSFKDMKDSDIAKKIASETGLSPEVDNTATKYPYISQNNQSNYDFLSDRVKRIGYEMFVDAKKFIFRKSAESKAPDLTLQHALDLQSFSIKVKTLTEGSEVEVRGWDIKEKKEISFIASKGSETTKMSGKVSGFELSGKAFAKSPSPTAVIDEQIIDSSHAENMAKAKYNSALKEFISGEGVCGGNPAIRAGKTVEIKGVGKRFSGPYYIVSTVHAFDSRGYTTKFNARRTGI